MPAAAVAAADDVCKAGSSGHSVHVLCGCSHACGISAFWPGRSTSTSPALPELALLLKMLILLQ